MEALVERSPSLEPAGTVAVEGAAMPISVDGTGKAWSLVPGKEPSPAWRRRLTVMARTRMNWPFGGSGTPIL